MKPVPDEVSDYMATIGSKGGKSGAGEKKKRSAAHYKRMVEIRRKNKAAREAKKR